MRRAARDDVCVHGCTHTRTCARVQSHAFDDWRLHVTGAPVPPWPSGPATRPVRRAEQQRATSCHDRATLSKDQSGGGAKYSVGGPRLMSEDLSEVNSCMHVHVHVHARTCPSARTHASTQAHTHTRIVTHATCRPLRLSAIWPNLHTMLTMPRPRRRRCATVPCKRALHRDPAGR